MKTKIFAAQVLGTQAFNAGKPMIPALDAELRKILEGVKVGQGLPILKAWVWGWTLANLT